MPYVNERTAGRTKRNCTAYILIGKSDIELPVIYVGKATTFPSRMSTHFSYLKDNKHHSSILQQFCNRNGIHNMLCVKIFSSDLNLELVEQIEVVLYKVFLAAAQSGKFVLANGQAITGPVSQEAVGIVQGFIANPNNFQQEPLSKYDYSEFWKNRPRTK